MNAESLIGKEDLKVNTSIKYICKSGLQQIFGFGLVFSFQAFTSFNIYINKQKSHLNSIILHVKSTSLYIANFILATSKFYTYTHLVATSTHCPFNIT